MQNRLVYETNSRRKIADSPRGWILVAVVLFAGCTSALLSSAPTLVRPAIHVALTHPQLTDFDDPANQLGLPYTFISESLRDDFAHEVLRDIKRGKLSVYLDAACSEPLTYEALLADFPQLDQRLKRRFYKRGQLPKNLEEGSFYRLDVETLAYYRATAQPRGAGQGIQRSSSFVLVLRNGNDLLQDYRKLYLKPDEQLPIQKLKLWRDYNGLENITAEEVWERGIWNFRLLSMPSDWDTAATAQCMVQPAQQRLPAVDPGASKSPVWVQIPFYLTGENHAPALFEHLQADMGHNRDLMTFFAEPLLRDLVAKRKWWRYQPKAYRQDTDAALAVREVREQLADRFPDDAELNWQYGEFGAALAALELQLTLTWQADSTVSWAIEKISLVLGEGESNGLGASTLGYIPVSTKLLKRYTVNGQAVTDWLATRRPYQFVFEVQDALPQDFYQAEYLARLLFSGRWDSLPTQADLLVLRGEELKQRILALPAE